MHSDSEFRDQIAKFEANSPEIRLELVDGQLLVGGSLMGSRWLMRELLQGWGLESAIGFAPLESWYNALNAFCPSTTVSNWAAWAEDLAYSAPEFLPLGSRHLGEHRFVRERLARDLSLAVSIAHLGTCNGRDFLMHLGKDAFTPDVMFMGTGRLKHFHHWFFDGAADLVIEVLKPEQAQIDRQERFRRYEAGGVPHYWIVDPVQHQVELFRLTDGSYRQATLDPDGCYRGLAPLTFTPGHLWLPHNQPLPVFSAPYRKSSGWVLRDTPGEDLTWGSLTFKPQVDLNPVPIQFDQFVSWCPEAKLEGYGGHYPLVGGELGSRNALGLLLMSLGLLETVKLFPPQAWVAALQKMEQQFAQDADCRQQVWNEVSTLVQILHDQHHVQGIGIIGDLLDEEQPWHFWSKILLVIWDAPERLDLWEIKRNLNQQFALSWIHPPHCTPSEWQQITTQMRVLVGNWDATQLTPQPKRLQLFRENDSTAS
jgi:hypothetical protein